MIGFWLAAAALTAVAVLLLLRPLLRPAAEMLPTAAFSRGIYTDQLAEIERDLGRGLLTPEQARAARAEVGRRLLAAAAEADKADKGRHVTAGPSRRLAMVLTVLLPLAALGVYLPLGRPDLPAVPFASRTAGPQVPPQVLQAMERLERSLKDNPDNLEGWTLLGGTYAALGRHADAAEAYRKAVGLSQGNAELMSAFAESLTNAADGIVGPEAQSSFEAVLATDPGDARARYYLGIARQQAGDLQGAIDRWAALLKDSPADAPWVEPLRQRIRAVAEQIGVDPATVTPQPLPPSQPPAMAEGGPTAEQMQSMAAMSPEQRQGAIRGMVDGLEARLKDNPADVEGWLRLARARGVLGEPQAALDALRQATRAAPERVDVWLALAQSLAPAEDQPASPEFLETMRTVLRLDADNPQALYYLGEQAAAEGQTGTARDLFTRLLTQLPADAPIRADLQKRLEALR